MKEILGKNANGPGQGPNSPRKPNQPAPKNTPPGNLPAPGMPGSKDPNNTVHIEEGQPLNKLFECADLPEIDLPPGSSFYVHVQHNCCGMCASVIQLYIGTKETHTELIAEAKMPHCLCNCCCKCCLSSLCETNVPVYNAQQQLVGELQIAKDCSIMCCLPRVKVFVKGTPGGIAWTRCCMGVTCKKNVGNFNDPLIFFGLKCIKDKVCSCLFPPWCCYRCCCGNKTVEESFVLNGDQNTPAFELVNVKKIHYFL